MIKRYGLGAKPEKITDESVQFGLMGIVERPDGEYYKASDVDSYLESIGAGGVSGRITNKTIEQHRAEFERFASSHGLSVNQDTSTGSGLFNSHVVGWMWKAWKAAKGISNGV